MNIASELYLRQRLPRRIEDMGGPRRCVYRKHAEYAARVAAGVVTELIAKERPLRAVRRSTYLRPVSRRARRAAGPTRAGAAC